jgi:hypothetical protein
VPVGEQTIDTHRSEVQALTKAKAAMMQLNSCQPLSIIVLAGRPNWFEIGSLPTTLAVIGLLILTISPLTSAPGATFPARLAKWILVLISTWLLIAEAIFIFGSPLAGVVYWSSCSLAATLLLPLAMLLLMVGSFRSGSLRPFLPLIAACMLLALLCFVAT